MTKLQIEEKIKELVNEYGILQKRYNGDSCYSKRIEAEIDRLECLLTRAE